VTHAGCSRRVRVRVWTHVYKRRTWRARVSRHMHMVHRPNHAYVRPISAVVDRPDITRLMKAWVAAIKLLRLYIARSRVRAGVRASVNRHRITPKTRDRPVHFYWNFDCPPAGFTGISFIQQRPLVYHRLRIDKSCHPLARIGRCSTHSLIEQSKVVARIVQSRFRDESVNSETLVCIKAHELSATDIFPGDKTRTSIGTE